MARRNNQRDWLEEYEETRQQEQSVTSSAPRPSASRYRRQTTGSKPGQQAVIPAQDWVDAMPAPTGISQEPNSPWAVAIHDPFERQAFVDNPGRSGYSIRWRRALPRATQRSSSGWGDVMPAAYSRRGYGGGGGGGGRGGGWGDVMPAAWWNPGLVNWRYGVRY